MMPRSCRVRRDLRGTVACLVGTSLATVSPVIAIVCAAPEMRSGEQYHGMPADMWALGVTLYSFLFGDVPFKASPAECLAAARRCVGPSRLPPHPCMHLGQSVSSEALAIKSKAFTSKPSPQVSIIYCCELCRATRWMSCTRRSRRRSCSTQLTTPSGAAAAAAVDC